MASSRRDGSLETRVDSDVTFIPRNASSSNAQRPLLVAIVSDQVPCFRVIQLGKPGGQQLHESGFPEIRVIAQELFDGLDVFGHFSLASNLQWPGRGMAESPL